MRAKVLDSGVQIAENTGVARKGNAVVGTTAPTSTEVAVSVLPASQNTTSVYVLGIEECPGIIKVGIARNVSIRVSELQTANPFRLRLLAKQDFPSRTDARGYEAELHRSLRESRLNGEWFRVPPHWLHSVIQSVTNAGDV